MFSTPEEVAKLAASSNANLIGASSLAAGHNTLLPNLIAQLKAIGREDIKVVSVFSCRKPARSSMLSSVTS